MDDDISTIMDDNDEFNEVMETTADQELDDILEEALRGEDVVMEESGMVMNVSVTSWSEEEDNFDEELITMKFPLHI